MCEICLNGRCAVCNDLVFFFKQKTAYEMRISDWSSDVCSSDLRAAPTGQRDHPPVAVAGLKRGQGLEPLGGGSKPVQTPVIAEQQALDALRLRVAHVADPAELRHTAKRCVAHNKRITPEATEDLVLVHSPRPGRAPDRWRGGHRT